MADIHTISERLPVKVYWRAVSSITDDMPLFVDELGVSVDNVSTLPFFYHILDCIFVKKLISGIQKKYIVSVSCCQTFIHRIVYTLVFLGNHNVDPIMVGGDYIQCTVRRSSIDNNIFYVRVGLAKH